MNELPRIERWLANVLAADVQIAAAVGNRVYHDQAPEGAMHPFVLFNYQAGRDVNGVGTCRVMARALYQVKVIARDALNDATRLAADRIDEIVGKAVRAQHPSDNSLIFNGRRESPISYTEPERDSSRTFRHLGGLYWIDASAA